jgi:DNA-binding transcriptional LysR family regulator
MDCKAASGSAKDTYRLRVHDAETAMQSVLAGLGKTLLPTVIGAREPRLQRLETDARSPLPLREMWLLAMLTRLIWVALLLWCRGSKMW